LGPGIEPSRTRRATPSDNDAHERLHRDIALEVEAVSAATPQEQQRVLDAWRADFNNNRAHEALGMKTPAQVYKPNAKSYAGSNVDLVYPERMLVRTVSGSGSIKHGSRMIQLTSALATLWP
jgi:putative transposase